jgi:hypothetical protein
LRHVNRDTGYFIADQMRKPAGPEALRADLGPIRKEVLVRGDLRDSSINAAASKTWSLVQSEKERTEMDWIFFA